MEMNPVWIKNLVVPRRKEETFKNGGWIFICYVQLTSNCGDNLHSSTSGLIIVVQLQLYSFYFYFVVCSNTDLPLIVWVELRSNVLRSKLCHIN